jgi:hypothetical protein
MYTPITITSETGRVLARVANDLLRSDNEEHLKRYTIFVTWRDEEDCEEIDVDAVNVQYARQCAEAELVQGYAKGSKISHIEERFGLYM